MGRIVPYLGIIPYNRVEAKREIPKLKFITHGVLTDCDMLLQGRKKGKEVTGGTINSHYHLRFPTSNPLTTSNNCTPYRTRTYDLLISLPHYITIAKQVC